MLRQLIVNADDLGLTAGVNDGIFDAHALGVLTSASLFANGPVTGDAIRRSRAFPALGLGAHLTLVDGTPILQPRQIPTLVTGDGRFRHSWKPFIVACLRGRVSLAEVEQELAAQIERLQNAGIVLTHLDAHKHVHAYPPIFSIVARLAVRFGIPVVRVPYERLRFRSRAPRRQVRLQPAPTFAQAALNAAMWPWAAHDRRISASLGLRTPHFAGRIHTGALNRPGLHSILRGLRPGVTELMVHPGYADDALARTGTRLLRSRQEELALLCSMDTRAVLFAERVDLIRHDLVHTTRRSLRHVSEECRRATTLHRGAALQ